MDISRSRQPRDRANWSCCYEVFEHGAGFLEWYNKERQNEPDYAETELKIAGLINTSKFWQRLYHLSSDIAVGDLIQRTAGVHAVYKKTGFMQSEAFYHMATILPFDTTILTAYRMLLKLLPKFAPRMETTVGQEDSTYPNFLGIRVHLEFQALQ